MVEPSSSSQSLVDKVRNLHSITRSSYAQICPLLARLLAASPSVGNHLLSGLFALNFGDSSIVLPEDEFEVAKNAMSIIGKEQLDLIQRCAMMATASASATVTSSTDENSTNSKEEADPSKQIALVLSQIRLLYNLKSRQADMLSLQKLLAEIEHSSLCKKDFPSGFQRALTVLQDVLKDSSLDQLLDIRRQLVTQPSASDENKFTWVKQCLHIPEERLIVQAPLLVLLSVSDGNDMLRCYHIIVDLSKLELVTAARICSLSPAVLNETLSLVSSLDELPQLPVQPKTSGDSASTHPSTEQSLPNGVSSSQLMNFSSGLHSPKTPTLFIIVQPPDVCVYKRNVKPAPTLLVSNLSSEEKDYYCVVPMLYRCDLSANETQSLAGREHIHIPANRIVTFRKLKIQVTSRMLYDSPLLLGFELRRYAIKPFSRAPIRDSATDDTFVPLSMTIGSPPNEGDHEYTVVHSIMSTPIIVVSHSSQLHAIESTLNHASFDPSQQTAEEEPAEIKAEPVEESQDKSNLPDPTEQVEEPPAKVHESAAEGQISIREVVPSHGPVAGSTRVVITGDGFDASQSLRVSFGTNEVVPVILGPRSLLCVTPPMQYPGTVPISVRAGKTKAATDVLYTFD